MTLHKTLLALALASTTAQQDDTCYARDRGSCWSMGYADQQQSAELCQVQCIGRPGCNYFSWHPGRGDKRCHLCKNDRDRTGNDCKESTWAADPDKRCWFGQRDGCIGDDADVAPYDPTILVSEAVARAEAVCAQPSGLVYFDTLLAAAKLSGVVKQMVRGAVPPTYDLDGFKASVAADAARAAAVLADPDCAPTPCNAGASLWTVLETFLAVYDEGADRAFATDPERRSLFNEHQVFLADAHWLDDRSVSRVRRFFDQVPEHLAERGLRHGAPYLTMTVAAAYNCAPSPSDPDYAEQSRLGGISQAGFLSHTARGFNVFKRQAGERIENAFGGTPFRANGDLLMTVVRHEAAHQYDRTMSARQLDLRKALQDAADKDEDWLRAGVNSWPGGGGAANFFKSATGEIIASQVGNQYFLSSSTQLAVARHYADHRDGRKRSLTPMAFFLLNADVVGSEDRLHLYENEHDDGKVDVHAAALERREYGGPISRLRIPGCGTFSFSYDGDQLAGYSYDGRGPCVPGGSGYNTGFPTPMPVTTGEPTSLRPTPQPTVALSDKWTFPKCGVRAYRGDANEKYCETNPNALWGYDHALGDYREFRFNCCVKNDKTCTRSIGGVCVNDGKAATWYQGMEQCDAAGLELCAVDSGSLAHSPSCKGKGCQHDGKYAWTQIPCEPDDIGYDPTCISEHPTPQPTFEPSKPPTEPPTLAPTPVTCAIDQPGAVIGRYGCGWISKKPANRCSLGRAADMCCGTCGPCPGACPTEQPTPQPSRRPTRQPTARPTHRPTPQPSRRPTRQPTVPPTHRPTRFPTRRPTAPPTPKPLLTLTPEPTPGSDQDDCANDPDWFFRWIWKGRQIVKDCAWVGAKSSKRCDYRGDGGVLASEACPLACEMCTPACHDDPLWVFPLRHKGKIHSKDCSWIAAKNTRRRCRRRGTDGRLASDACGCTCA